MNPDTLLKILDLKTALHTDSGIIKAVDEVNLKIPRGKIIGLVGESGCGKTMAALSILRILPVAAKITGGQIIFEGTNLINLNENKLANIRGKDIAMIFQEPFSSLNPVIKTGHQIADVITAHQKLANKEIRPKVLAALKHVNLLPAERIFESYPHQLSGGQRQRVMIAMAISLNPKLLIADEPTSALDVTTQSELIKLLLQLKDELGLSILFITHDLHLIKKIADFIYVMYLGKIVEEGEAKELFRLPLHPYTQGLLASIPDAGKRGKPLSAIKGLPADMLSVPSGCPFHPRCPIAEEKCSIDLQKLELKINGNKASCWKVK